MQNQARRRYEDETSKLPVKKDERFSLVFNGWIDIQ